MRALIGKVTSRFGLALLGITIALGVSEIALRILDVARDPLPIRVLGGENRDAGIREDPEILWVLRERAGPDPVNALGLRGRLPYSTKGPRELRIVCLGDSCTYGLHVQPEEAWPEVLRDSLQVLYPDIEVTSISAAVPGHSTFQSRALLERLDTSAEGDVTILYLGAWNDMLPAVYHSDAAFVRLRRNLETAWYLQPRIGRVAWRWAHPVPSDAELYNTVAALDEQSGLARARVPISEFRDNLRSIVSRASRSGRVIGILPPLRPGDAQLAWVPAYRHELVNVYREAGIPVLDPLTAMTASISSGAESSAASPFLDPVHPSAAGYRNLVEALLPFVRSAGEDRLATIRGVDRPMAPALRAVNGQVVPVGSSATLRLVGWLPEESSLRVRGWVNRVDCGEPRAGKAGELAFEIPGRALSRPGPATMMVRTPSGAVSIDTGIEVRSP